MTCQVRSRKGSAIGLFVILLLPCFSGATGKPSGSPSSRAEAQPVVVFVHGRGQSENSENEVKERFFRSFLAEQQKLYGQPIVPRDALRFVWYADVIDPTVERRPDTQDCRFLNLPQLEASALLQIRRSLIRLAQAAKLDDIGLSLLAGDTYKYLTRPEVRCEADERVSVELRRDIDNGHRVVLVAHSMGGIVSFSALDKESRNATQNALHVSSFITMGTQIGATEVLQGLLGQFVKPPVALPNSIDKWTDFRNAGDALSFPTENQFSATNALRAPIDVPVSGIGPAHSVETYLSIAGVTTAIVEDWCEASDSPVSGCGLTRRHGSQLVYPGYNFGVIADTVGIFFRLPSPTLAVAPETDVSRVVDFGSRDRPATIQVSASVLKDLNDNQPLYSDDALFFIVAHETSHVAQRLLRGPGSSSTALVDECEADMWGASALVAALPFDGDGVRLQAKVNAVLAIVSDAGDIFDPIDGDIQVRIDAHPRSDQRALCAAKGMSSGLQIIRLRQIAGLSQPEGRRAASEFAAIEPDLFSSRDDLWPWTRSNAEQIAYDKLWSNSPLVSANNFAQLAEAAETGPSALARVGAQLSSAPPLVCKVERRSGSVAVVCSAVLLDSRKLEYIFYDSVHGVLFPTLFSRGWMHGAPWQSDRGLRETVSKGAAAASIELDYLDKVVRFEFTASTHS